MHFTLEAQNRCRPWIPTSSIVVDATAGNGFDTHFLAECVGPEGRVYSLDIQPGAISRTREKVSEAGYSHRVECILGNHAELGTLIPTHHHGMISCVMFNLGYLPHSDKSITTNRDTTIAALEAASSMLGPSAILSILAYVGHPTGLQESLAVEEWITKKRESFRVERLVDQSNPSSPILWLLSKPLNSLDS